jgi:DegV family protein with EDD domain
MTIGFVTDSTAYLPLDVVNELDIEVVPVHVVVDGADFSEVQDITMAEVAAKMRAGSVVTTSRPSSHDFVAAYDRLRARGYDEIISVHLSSQLSGTYEAAMLAAAKCDYPVRVIDSSAVAMMMGFSIISGVQFAREGASLDDVEDHIRLRCEQSSLVFAVSTVEFLERGGRISHKQARLAARLSVKPLLQVKAGSIVLREIVRSNEKANFKLIDYVRGAGSLAYDVAVLHVEAQERGTFIAEQLKLRLGRTDIPLIAIGPVVGAHVGPGAVAVALSPLV